MTTIRVEKRHRYTSIDRGTLNDSRLSFRARGILAYLLDKPDDWRTNAGAIAAAGREGREAVRTALAELEAAGYLVRRKWRNRAGRWESEWTVHERPDPADMSGFTQPRKPTLLTSPGYPTREPGPQVLKTETEDGPSEIIRLFDSSPLAAPPWLDKGMTYAEWAASEGDESVASVDN